MLRKGDQAAAKRLQSFTPAKLDLLAVLRQTVKGRDEVETPEAGERRLEAGEKLG